MNIFYNRSEHRIRAFWRLLLQIILLILAFIALGIALGLAAVVWVAFSGQVPTETLRNTPALASLIGQAIASNPLLVVLSGLFTLLSILLSVAIAGRWLDRRAFRDFGLHLSRAWWRDWAFGLGLGALLMLLIFAVEWAAGWITVTGLFRAPASGFATGILQSAITFVFVGFYEELFSRGYQLRNLAEGLNWRRIGPRGALLLAYFLSSLVFGGLHQANPNSTSLTTLQLMLAGLFLGLGMILTGELAIPIGIHITWNFFQGPVFGFPVSGTLVSTSVFAVQQSGPEIWTGGAWGPEGGLVGILALLIGAAAILLWVRYVRGSDRPDTGLAVYKPRQKPERQRTPLADGR